MQASWEHCQPSNELLKVVKGKKKGKVRVTDFGSMLAFVFAFSEAGLSVNGNLTAPVASPGFY